MKAFNIILIKLPIVKASLLNGNLSIRFIFVFDTEIKAAISMSITVVHKHIGVPKDIP
jgi:hypothetical protein